MKTLTALLVIALVTACSSNPPNRYKKPSRTEVQQARSDAAATNVQLAIGYIREGDLETALEKVERAISLDPNSADANTVAGIVYEQINDTESAGFYYKKAAKLDPQNGNALNNYGQYLCRTGRVDEAVKYFEQAVQQPFYKTPGAALINAGSCREQQNRLVEAEVYYRQTLEFEQQSATALISLARLMLKKGDAFKARAFLQRYESSSPSTAESLLLGAEIEKQLGNEQGKEKYGEQLLKQFPDSPESIRYKQTAQP